MEGYGLGSHLLCLCFCGCVMIGYAISVFTPLFLLFQLSTARVRHVPIRMVSSIWGRFLMPWPRVSSGAYVWVGDFEVATSRSDSSELGESRSSWLIRPIWTFGLELVKKILFWIFVFCFSEAEFLGRYLFFVGVLCLRNQCYLTCELFFISSPNVGT